MENQEAPESPEVTYPMDAAAPGFNWHDNRPSPSAEDNEVYVPVQQDEDYIDFDFTMCREPPILPPPQSLSAILRTTFATPSVPSLFNSTNPAPSGASLSSASAAVTQFRLSSLLSSASAAALSLRTGATTVLSGIPALSFAAATVLTLQNSNAGEVLPNFSANLTLCVNLPAHVISI